MTKSILVKLPEPVWKAFRTLAIERGCSNAKLVEQLVLRSSDSSDDRTREPAKKKPQNPEEPAQTQAPAGERDDFDDMFGDL